ncbi:unnamed protein product [Schistosoma curassoni]|uniref:Uncharacterized protein n=1 Tax=Schistosoma curassoni TaxID=6186 RepID=A0A183KGJ8_9TREM|nr:unnamed protein product [Schistosoma curassoni]
MIHGHIESVCNTTIHLAATNIKCCNSDSIRLSIYNDHLSSSTIAIDSVESHSSSELNETQNPCKTTVSNLYGFFTNDSHISDEIPCKCEENMLSEPNHDRKPDGVLIDADFANDPLLCNDILNKFDENHFGNYQILMSYQILFVLIMHLLLVGNVLSEKHSYRKVTSNVYSSQCEEYVSNEATSSITLEYEDPTLFRMGG